jgi:APA family basic amino acid/polyamine antiporter
VNQVHLGSTPTWGQVAFALSISMLAYTGIETVSNMAEEARDPGRDVPRAVNYLLVAVLGIYAGISVVALSALPVHNGTTALGTTFQSDPVLGIVSALHLSSGLQTALSYYVAILAATILIIATNAGLIGISRLSWSLAEHRQLPRIFARLHRRYRTPVFTIGFFSILAVLLLLPGENAFLGNLYSFGAMLSFTVAHASVVILRIREPDRERPYRAPWNVRIRGHSIPLTAVFGGIGTFATWVSLVVLHTDARYVGFSWLALGLVGYAVYRRRNGLDLVTSYKIEHPARPHDFEELAYVSALVPIFGTDVNGDAMRAAAKLAGEQATVEALYVIQVPPQLSLDAAMDEEERRASQVLDAARLRGREYRLKVRTGTIRTRNPGAALVEEAKARHSDVVYLDTVHAPASEQALGPTALYLLRERPCRIVVETSSNGRRNGHSVNGSG